MYNLLLEKRWGALAGSKDFLYRCVRLQYFVIAFAEVSRNNRLAIQ